MYISGAFNLMCIYLITTKPGRPQIFEEETRALKLFGYHVYIKGNNGLLAQGDKHAVIFFGSALYKKERVTKDNLGSIVEHVDYHLGLSGRFLIVKITSEKLEIINSIFGSYPCYINGDNTVISSNANIAREVAGEGISVPGIREKILYYCNYGESKYTNITPVQPASVVAIVGSRRFQESYMSEVVRIKDKVTSSEALRDLAEAIRSNIRSYFPVNSRCKVAVSFTGGRDSRTLLYALHKEGVQDLKAFTVGNSRDVEYFVGREFTKKLGIKHEIIQPEKIDNNHAQKYAKYFDNINFPSLYKPQLLSQPSLQNVNVVNTIIPETLLCHMDYFRGEEHPAVNFLRKRVSCFYSKKLNWKAEIIVKAEQAAIEKWNCLRSMLPNDTVTNIFFGIVTFQTGWCFNILRPYDITGEVVCLMEDPQIISILGSIPQQEFHDDNLYASFIKQEFNSIHDTPTTRQLELRSLRTIKPKVAFRYAHIIIRGLVFPGSLAGLLKENSKYIIDTINKKRPLLDIYFGPDETDTIISDINEGVYGANRIEKLVTKLKARKILNDYELLTPFCLISLHEINASLGGN